MTTLRSCILVFVLFFFYGCNSNECTESQAYDKMMALGRVSARITASGTKDEGAQGLMVYLTEQSGKISELIAAKKYNEACAKAEEVAKSFKIDLAQEAKGMVTFDQLQKDGGKGSGECSLADASIRMMDFHKQLQEQVDAGKMDSDIFRQFNDDTKDFGLLMTSDPSAVCKRLEEMKPKYKLSK